MGRASGFQVFTLGTGIETSIKDLIAFLQKVSSVKFTVDYRPGRIADVPVNVFGL